MLGLCATAPTPVQAQEPVVLYDSFNFNGLLLNPRKWGGGSLGLWRDARRHVQGVLGAGALRLDGRAYGQASSNTGRAFSVAGIGFQRNTNNALVRALQATFVVQAVQSVGCAANPASPTEARVGLVGFYFNTGPRTPGRATNDVLAALELVRASNSTDPANVLRVRAFVVKCTNADCTTFTVLFARSSLGTVPLNAGATLRMDWQPGLNRFLFRLNANPFVVAPYAVPDSLDPANDIHPKAVGLRHHVANCAAVSPRPVAYVRALVDNVFVNTAAFLAVPAADEADAASTAE